MRLLRNLAVVMFIFLIFFIATVSGFEMIVFPEILAILIGMLCTDRMPWKTDGLHTVLLMSIAAFTGIAIVKFIPFSMYVQALIALAIVALYIILSDCTMMPCIAACLFPIYFKESSYLYPVLVMLMVTSVVMLRLCFKNNSRMEETEKFRYSPDFEVDLKLWGMIILAYAILSAILLFMGNIFIVALPLVVMLVEGSYKRLEGKRLKIWFVITVAAVIGVLVRRIAVEMFTIPMYIAAAGATALALLEMRLMNMMFPTAGTVLILAFIAEGDILIYPPMISVGAAVVLLVSAFINARVEV